MLSMPCLTAMHHGHASWTSLPKVLFCNKSELIALLLRPAGVRLVSRADCCLYQSQKLYVYLSPQTTFRGAGSVLCKGNITFTRAGQSMDVLCPLNTTARFVTVQLNGTNYLSLNEFVPLIDREAWHAAAPAVHPLQRLRLSGSQ